MSRVQLIFQNYQEKITLGFCLLLSFILIFNNDSDSIKNAFLIESESLLKININDKSKQKPKVIFSW